MELTKEFRFEASHILPKHPGKCSRLHGHSWVLKVSVEGVINPETGFVMDYADLKKVVQPVIDKIDHTHLGVILEGELEGLWTIQELVDIYPSSENLIFWIADQLDALDGYMLYNAGVWRPRNIDELRPFDIKNLNDKHFWSKLELNETCTSACVLTRADHDYLQHNDYSPDGGRR